LIEFPESSANHDIGTPLRSVKYLSGNWNSSLGHLSSNHHIGSNTSSVKCQSGRWDSSLGQLSASEDVGTALWVSYVPVRTWELLSGSFKF